MSKKKKAGISGKKPEKIRKNPRGRKRKHNYKEIAEAYEAGMSMRQIAQALDTDPQHIFNILKKEKVISRSKLKTRKHDYKEIVEAYQSGMTMRQIAKVLDTDPSLIHQVLKKMKIPARSRYAKNPGYTDNRLWYVIGAVTLITIISILK